MEPVTAILASSGAVVAVYGAIREMLQRNRQDQEKETATTATSEAPGPPASSPK